MPGLDELMNARMSPTVCVWLNEATSLRSRANNTRRRVRDWRERDREGGGEAEEEEEEEEELVQAGDLTAGRRAAGSAASS
jgi:hypothetical protein